MGLLCIDRSVGANDSAIDPGYLDRNSDTLTTNDIENRTNSKKSPTLRSGWFRHK